ncbi:19472_t:CDS:2, partial [Funneliformis geosporum]
MTKIRLSTWLRSGTIEQNFKDTLEATLGALNNACPLNKLSNNSIRNSLYDILSNDKAFREKSTAHTTVFDWLSNKSSSSCKEKPFAVFKKKTRFYASTIAVGPNATANSYNNNVVEPNATANSYNNNVVEPNATADSYNNNVVEPQESGNGDNSNVKTRDSSPPPVKQTFSFANDEQEAIIEPYINFVEKALYKFLIDNEHIIPSKIVESFVAKQHPRISPDFENADILCMIKFITENISIFLKKSTFHGRYKLDPTGLLINFKNNVRNQMAHGIIIDEKGRWSDLALQNVAHLACEIVACLGGDYQEVYGNKENFDDEIIQRLISKSTKVSRPPKRKFNDISPCEIAEFVSEVLEDFVEADKEQKQQIMKLTLKKDEYMMYIWRMIEKQSKKEKILNFVRFVNLTFGVNLTVSTLKEVPKPKEPPTYMEDKFSHSLAQVGVGVQLTLSNALWGTNLLVSVGLVGLTEDKRSYLFCVLPIDYL